MRITEPENMSSTLLTREGENQAHFVYARRSPGEQFYKFYHGITGEREAKPLLGKNGRQLQSAFIGAIKFLSATSESFYMGHRMKAKLIEGPKRDDHFLNYAHLVPQN